MRGVKNVPKLACTLNQCTLAYTNYTTQFSVLYPFLINLTMNCHSERNLLFNNLYSLVDTVAVLYTAGVESMMTSQGKANQFEEHLYQNGSFHNQLQTMTDKTQGSGDGFYVATPYLGRDFCV